MGITIGDINIPFVSGFSVDKADKPIEVIKHLGNIPPHVAEFQADVLKATISGTLFQASGDVRDVDQYAEDLDTLVDRFGVYNYINDYQSRSGWLILSTGDSDISADSVLIRKYSLVGRFMPKNKYQTRMHTAPAILTNDFSLTLGAGGCDNYVPLPIGATYSGGDGSTITRIGKDGTTTLIKATTDNDIKWDIDADEVDVGECKVWDSVIVDDATETNWVRIFNPDHVFTGDCIIENGLIRLQKINAIHPIMYSYDAVAVTWDRTSSAIAIVTTGTTTISGIYYYNFKSISPDTIEVERRLYSDDGVVTQKIIIYQGKYLIKFTSSDSIFESVFLNIISIYDGKFIYCNNTLWDIDLGVGVSTDYAIEYYSVIGKADSIKILASTGGSRLFVGGSPENAGYSDVDDDSVFIGEIKAAYVTNLFKECEAMTQGAGVAYYTGADASPTTGNTGSILNAQNENIYYEFTGGTDLPLGTYKLFLRAKDSAQVADDISCLVRNTTDSTDVMAKTTKTLTGSWAYYSFDVTIASDDDTDTIRVTLNKETAIANTIDLDYVLWVPITLDSGNGPQDIAHQAMIDQNLTRELIAR